MRYEDDFGSYWTVDDAEFVRRRHLSRGRPRKYEPQSSSNQNDQCDDDVEISIRNDSPDNTNHVNIF